MINKSNCKSYAVLAAIFDIADEDDAKSIHTEGYVNGREQGLCVSMWIHSKRKVCFSEGRNHDGIVLYYGNYQEFSMQGNVPNEETYRRSRTFEPHDYLNAAGTAYSFLVNGENSCDTK